MQLDLFAGQALKLAGMERVLDHNEEWKDLASQRFAEFTRTRVGSFSIDDFKDYACLPQPKHPNAWGAFWSSLAKGKLILPTGNYVKSRYESRHAAVVQLWTKPV